MINKPHDDKTYKMACASIEDSDQPRNNDIIITVFYLLCIHMATKDLCWYLHAGISDSGQTIKMLRSLGYERFPCSINLSMKFHLLRKTLKYRYEKPFLAFNISKVAFISLINVGMPTIVGT